MTDNEVELNTEVLYRSLLEATPEQRAEFFGRVEAVKRRLTIAEGTLGVRDEAVAMQELIRQLEEARTKVHQLHEAVQATIAAIASHLEHDKPKPSGDA